MTNIGSIVLCLSGFHVLCCNRSLEVSNEYPIELIKTNKKKQLQLMSEDQYENWFFTLKTSLSWMVRWFKSEI